MTEALSGYRAWLEHPKLFGWTQELFVRRDCRRVLVERYLKPVAGERLLDLGCGTGLILDYLPILDYWGLDANPRCVVYAKKKYGTRARFERADLLRTPWPVRGPFDRALAVGLLHHLKDEEVSSVLAQARRALKPGGTLVTLDGCYEKGQSWPARLMLRLDRGRYVRDAEGYLSLARPIFPKLRSQIERGFLRVPYSHLVMEMTVG